MPETRNLFLIALAVLAFLMWSQWQQDYARQAQPAEPTPGQQTVQPPGDGNIASSGVNAELPVPTSADIPVPITNAETPSLQVANAPNAGFDTSNLIHVTTDVLELLIDPRGGSVVSAKLLNYPVEVNTPDIPVQLMQRQNGTFYVAQSGLLSANHPAPTHQANYQSRQTEYRLAEGQDSLEIPLSWNEAGINVTKTLTLRRGEYVIDTVHALNNQSGQAWQGNRYVQLQRTKPTAPKGGLTDTSRYSFSGAAYYTPQDKFNKLKFDDFSDEPLNTTTDNGWIAMVQHYFMSAWLPPEGNVETFGSATVNQTGVPRYLLRYQSTPVQIANGQTHQFSSRLYVGPKLQDDLKGLANGLELTVDYGIFTIFSKPLFIALNWIHSVVKNWGWSIVILTLIIKLLFFKLTESQYKSMARIRKLQPRIEKLKERYGDDRQKMSEAMMELYKTEKANPLGGCLPVLIQIPIFIALYWVLLESVELRQAPFIFWIQDLSSPDPYFVLPIINGIAMVATQRMSPSPGMDPMQRKMMNALPVVFSVLFAFFPAGLVLYWATNAVISLGQQWFITKRIENAS